MVNLTINGKNIEVKDGTTVLNAARQAGIEIPTLCDHPELTPYGGCRLCLVEVEGARTLQPSCTLPASNNMVVQTETDKIKEARRFILTMIFSERNHFCPYCQVSGGDCELQNAAYAEGMTHWPLQPNWQPYPVDASHPFIILEHNRCILCRRCVRACGELVGNFTLGFEERGADSTLVADLGFPLGESSCVGCGTCVQVCPTGALIDRWSAYQGRETDVQVTKTICVGCSIGCGIDVLTRDNRLVRIEGDWDSPVNKGVICSVGRFLPMVEERDRLLTPMVRKDGTLKASTWDEALSAAADLMNTQNSSGKITGLVSTRLPLEAMHAFKALGESMNMNMVSTEEGQNTKAVFDLFDETKKPFEGSLDDVNIGDAFLVVGEDLTTDHQVVSFLVKRNLPAGAKLVLITTAETSFDPFTNLVLRIKPGQEKELLEGLNQLVASGSPSEISKFAEKMGIAGSLLSETLNALKASKNPVVIIGSRTAAGFEKETLASAVALSNAINAKVITTKGNINSFGAAQYKLDQPSNEKVPEFLIAAVGDESLSQQFVKKYEGAGRKVVFSSFISPLTVSADVVFPVTNWLEQSGHYLNMDGRLFNANAALNASDDVKPAQEALALLAEKLAIKVQGTWQEALPKQSPVMG